MKHWFKFHPQNESKTTVVDVWGTIGGDWFDEGVTADSFKESWDKIPDDHQIVVSVHSPGGSVWDGLAISHLIKDRASRTTADVVGVALSAGSFIAASAGKVRVRKTSRIMIHDAHGFEVGDSADMRKMADLLDAESDNIAKIYADKTGRPVSEIRDMMRKTTWMTGQEAFDMGFADEVVGGDAKPIEDFRNELSRFRSVPVPGNHGNNHPAEHGEGHQTENTMNKKAILALLAKHGKDIAADASDEVILAAFDELVSAGKIAQNEAEKLRNAPPPQPDNSGEIADLRAQLNREKRLRITARFDELSRNRVALVEDRDSLLNRAIADETFLDVLAKWPVDPEPRDAARREVGTTEPKEPENGREACALLAKLTDPVQIHDIYNRHSEMIRNYHFRSPRNANSFTTMTYTILAQEALQAFVYTMTPIRAFARNFSAAAVQRGDYIQVPFVSASDAALTFSGTYLFQDADATGKQVPIDTRKYVSWALTTEELATMPQLNMEMFAQQKGNALAYAVLQDIWGDITNANFGSDAITTMAGGDERTEAIADFDDETVRLVAAACDADNWPQMPRSLILSPAYYWTLLGDATVIGTQGIDNAQVLRTAQIRNVLGFDLYVSNAIPANGQNLAGFAVHPDALLIAMRSLVPEAGVANRPMVNVLTDPVSGMTIVQREWFDADNDRTKRVLECNFGSLVGNPIAAKQIVTS